MFLCSYIAFPSFCLVYIFLSLCVFQHCNDSISALSTNAELALDKPTQTQSQINMKWECQYIAIALLFIIKHRLYINHHHSSVLNIALLLPVNVMVQKLLHTYLSGSSVHLPTFHLHLFSFIIHLPIFHCTPLCFAHKLYSSCRRLCALVKSGGTIDMDLTIRSQAIKVKQGLQTYTSKSTLVSRVVFVIINLHHSMF